MAAYTGQTPDTHTRRHDWLQWASCRDPEIAKLYTSDTTATEAKHTCSTCPVQKECLAWVMTSEAGWPSTHRHGVAGGLTAQERAAADPRRRPTPSPEPTAEEPTVDPNPHTDPNPTTAPPTQRALSVGQLLAWAEKQKNKTVQAHAEKAWFSLSILRQAHSRQIAKDALDREAAELQQQLKENRARRAALSLKEPRDHIPAEVRAWARANNIPVSGIGNIPKPVLAAWRERPEAGQGGSA